MSIEFFLVIFAVAAIAFISGLVPLYTRLKKIPLHYWLAFAAGVLIATALFEMIPEVVGAHDEVDLEDAYELEELIDDHEDSNVELYLMLVAIGFFAFYLIEHLIIAGWHSRKYHGEKDFKGAHVHHTGYMGVFALAADNIVDGAAIAAAWMIDASAGLIVTFAVIAHEIPHSMAVTSIMKSAGAGTRKILLVLSLTALLFPLSALAIMSFGFFDLTAVLAFTAGSFLYFGASHLLPESHALKNKKIVLAFMAGVAVIFLAVTLSH
jgi:zinc and cadmium transporter